MQGKNITLSGEELNKFTTLVKSQGKNKLTATQLSHLDSHAFADYRKQVKQFARTKKVDSLRARGHPLTAEKRLSQAPTKSQNGMSYYYSDKL